MSEAKEGTAGLNLLDDQWQRQQEKTFKAWVNSHLRKRALKIENLSTDFCDGRMLIALMEIVGDTELPKPAKGNLRIHKVENVGKAFKYIKEKGVNLVMIAPEEIVDGNLKLILGMLWTLILRFDIQDISVEELSAKDALLLWAQRKTAPYDNVSVSNFHMSWKDGLAFCALIHRHRPEVIDYASLRKDNPKQNWKTCLEAAEKHLDIPPMLDAEDMISCIKPDERAVMTYVAAYYKAFASFNKNEVAAKKIAHIAETNRAHQKLIEEYEEKTTRLLEWIPIAIARLNERASIDTVDGCRAKLGEYTTYKTEEYPPKLEEKGDIEAHYSTLQTKLRLSGRPAYVPGEGKAVSDVAAAWKGLEAAEAAHKEFLAAELKRNLLCEYKAERFTHKANIHESWTSGRAESLTSDDYLQTNLAGVQALKKQHEAFQSDLAAHEPRVGEIGTLANELDELNFFRKDEINQRYADIYQHWLSLTELSDKRSANLEEAEKKQQRLDELRVQFAKQVAPLNNALDEWLDNLSGKIFVNSMEEVEGLHASLEEFKQSLNVPEAEYQALQALNAQMAELSTANSTNPYTTHTIESVTDKWGQLQALIPTREQQLGQEKSKQESHESLRHSWAQSAAQFQAWVAEQETAISTIITNSAGQKLEEQVAALKDIDAAFSSQDGEIKALEGLNKEIQEALIVENPHSQVSIEDVRGARQQLSGKVKRLQTELANAILLRDASSLTEEQIKEYRDSFNHFDRDGSKTLERLEFRACLISIGYDIPQRPPEDPANDTEFNRVLAAVDPNGDGVVAFDEYIAFMAAEHADAESSSELIEAFKVLAGDKPYVLAADIRRDLAADLAEYCISNMQPYPEGPEGALDYSTFAQSVYGEGVV
eukprot:m.673170 g.673170  ORF g.673170 m.673170 type:complete len:880 (+) comp58539_c0_seq1:176-2815(+)